MAIQRVQSQQAIERAKDAALVHIDVRSEQEFAAGHAPNAFNVPLMHMVGGGLAANPNFAAEVQRAAPDKDAAVMVSCKAGGRSAKAAAVLEQLGYRNISDQVGGWSGGNGDAGWQASGGPSATATLPGRSYREIQG